MAGTVGPEFRGARRRLVELLQANGIRDLSVLRAIDLTPRHLFVPTGVRHRAYEDSALPIGNGQTISQPSVHARYLELLQLTGVVDRTVEASLHRLLRRCWLTFWLRRDWRISTIRFVANSPKNIYGRLSNCCARFARIQSM